MNNGISLHLNLIEHIIDRCDIFNMHRHRRKRSIAYDFISRFKLLRVFKLCTYSFYLSAYKAACIRNRVVKLPSPYNYVYNGLFNFFFIVVYFCAYLLETGTLKVDSFDRNSYLIRVYAAAVIQFPCRSRQNIFRLKHSLESIVSQHLRFAPFSGEHKSVRF